MSNIDKIKDELNAEHTKVKGRLNELYKQREAIAAEIVEAEVAAERITNAFDSLEGTLIYDGR